MRLQLPRWLKNAFGICLIFFSCLTSAQSAVEKVNHGSPRSTAVNNKSNNRKDFFRKDVKNHGNNFKRTARKRPKFFRNETTSPTARAYKINNENKKYARKQTLYQANKNKELENLNRNISILDSNEELAFFDPTFETNMMPPEENYYSTNDVTDLSYSWAIKLPSGNSSNITDLHLQANRIADEHDLMNFGAIGGLHGYFYFVHNNFFNDGLQRNFAGHAFKMNITDTLTKHPEIEWVNHEEIRMRKKRALEFKDQFFPSQWHLVICYFLVPSTTELIFLNALMPVQSQRSENELASMQGLLQSEIR